MTTGLSTPSSYYLQLINSFPPRPINNESERLATQEKIDALLDKNHLTQGEHPIFVETKHYSRKLNAK